MSNFDSAFSAARKAGKKEFSFGGKKFNTKLREDAKPAKVKLPSRGPIPPSRPEATKAPAAAKAPAKSESIAPFGGNKSTLVDKAKNAMDLYTKGGVARRNTREAAASKNKNSAVDIYKMKQGMNKLKGSR